MTPWRPRLRSTSAEATENVVRAERAAERRRSHHAWRSVKGVVQWFFERKDAMQAPNCQTAWQSHPNDAEGGTRGASLKLRDVDEQSSRGSVEHTLLTLSAIGRVLHHLELAQPRQYAIVVAMYRDGKSARKLEEETGLSHQAISLELGRGEAFLAGGLRVAEVIA